MLSERGRTGGTSSLLNFAAEERELEVGAGGLELLTGVDVGPSVSLKPSGIVIIRHPVT